MTNSINIVLFGNPHGMGQIGGENTLYYQDTFYKTYTKEMPRKKFLISRLPDNTAVYTLVEYDLIAGKRPGGFFGMELRVEGAFHQQTEELIKFFEEEYVKHVEGNILLNTKDNGGRYCINNFSEREDVWQALLRDFQVYVDTHFTLDDSVLRRLLYGNSTWEKVIEPGEIVLNVQEQDSISNYKTRFSDLKEESDKLIAQRQSEKGIRTLAEIDNKLIGITDHLNELQNELQNKDTTIPEVKVLISSIEFQVGMISSVLNTSKGKDEVKDSMVDGKDVVSGPSLIKHFPSLPIRIPLNNILCGVLGFAIAWFLFGVMELGKGDSESGKSVPHDEIPKSLCEYYDSTNLVQSFKNLKERIQSAIKNSEYDKIRSIIIEVDTTTGWAYSASVKSALYEAAGRALIHEESTDDSTTADTETHASFEGSEGDTYTSPYYLYKISQAYYNNVDRRIHVEIIDANGQTISPIKDKLWLRVYKPNNEDYENFTSSNPSSCGSNQNYGTYKFELVDKTNNTIIDSYTYNFSLSCEYFDLYQSYY